MLRLFVGIRTVIFVTGLILVAGCWHVRNFAVTDAKDYGQTFKTKYKYWVQDDNKDFSSRFELENPSVFSNDGIPIKVHTYQAMLPSKSWSYLDGDDFLLFDIFYVCCQIGTGVAFLPLHMRGDEQPHTYIIQILDSKIPNVRVGICERNDKIASGYLPIASLLCYHGNPAPEAFKCGRSFETHEYKLGDSSDAKSNFTKALVYGVAAKLKEMEETGVINESTARNAAFVRANIDMERKRREEEIKRRQEQDRERRTYEARSKMLAMEQRKRHTTIGKTLQQDSNELTSKAPYHIVYLERDGKSDFAYRFAMELNGEPSIQTFFGVQKIFADEVRMAYQTEYPRAIISALRIAVQPRLVNGRIEGRAEVLTITPTSLIYDANTRRGKLAVKFNAGQAEEARAWIRKNIETLACDKNIALVAGQLPPSATYYSLGEKIDGNVMEIEFRTE